MNSESRDYLEMSFKAINCFADDGRLDVSELNKLLDIALRDGVVDENEKRVLNNIFDRLSDAELTRKMKRSIEEIRTRHEL